MAGGNERIRDVLFGCVIFTCGYILFFTEYGFEEQRYEVVQTVEQKSPLNTKELGDSQHSPLFQGRMLKEQDYVVQKEGPDRLRRTEIITVHRADLDNDHFVYNESWSKVTPDPGKMHVEINRPNREAEAATAAHIPQKIHGDEATDISNNAGDPSRLSVVDNTIIQSADRVKEFGLELKLRNKRRFTRPHLLRRNSNATQHTQSETQTVPRQNSGSPFLSHEQKYQHAQSLMAGQWKKYSEHKVNIVNMVPDSKHPSVVNSAPNPNIGRDTINAASINTEPVASYSATGISTDTMEVLKQLEQELLRLKAKLEMLDGNDLGGLNAMETEVPEEQTNQPIKVQVDDKSTITQSHTTVTKFVRNFPAPTFLPQFNNPCFIEKVDESATATKSYRRAARSCSTLRAAYPRRVMQVLSDVQVTVTDKSGHFEDGYRLRCLPYFYLLGFPKCGTTDIRSRLMLHMYIRDAACKEPQYWDRRRFERDINFADYLDLFNFGTQRIVSSEVNGYKPMLLGDFSTRTIGNEYYWEKYEGNEGLSEPKYLTAHEIKHLNPHSKFIISMRNPTERLYSDYMHFMHKSPEDFHAKVVASIAWWQTCLKSHTLRQCLYGRPHDMPELDPPGQYWTQPASAQLRTGLYIYYIVEWLELFSKEQFLFVEFKDYVNDEAGYITNIILPFLNLGPLDKRKERAAENKPKANGRFTHIKRAAAQDMFPETRTMLDEFYAPFNDRLADFLNDDKYRWHLRREN